MADSTRWESFGGLTTLRREMDRLFERVLGREASSPLGAVEPAIEVAETPAAVIVKAHVPGVSKEHLQVNVTETNRGALRGLSVRGATLEDVVRVHYILPDPDEFPACWPVLRKYLGEVRPAATMFSARLLDPRIRIEIEVTARRREDPGSGG